MGHLQDWLTGASIRRGFLAVGIVCLLAPSAPGAVQTGDRVPGVLIVELSAGALPQYEKGLTGGSTMGLPSVDQINAQYGLLSFRRLFASARVPQPPSNRPDLTGYHILHFPADADLDAAAAAYRADPAVISVEFDAYALMEAIPSDSLFGQMWNLRQASGHDVDADLAWDINSGDPAILLGVTDTGVLYNHPDLRDNIWVNSGEDLDNDGAVFDSDDMNGVDDDGNGYVDDLIGWDFVENGYEPGDYPVWPGEDALTPDNDPKDFHGHGTHTSGTIAAVTNNVSGVSGLAGGFGPGLPGCKIVCLRMGWSIDVGFELGITKMSYVAEAFVYGADMGARAINYSFGSGTGGGIEAATDYAVAAGVTICAAAGNDNSSGGFGYLQSRPDVLCVASTDQNDAKSYFSNYGPLVDISAPGSDIWSTVSFHYTPGYAVFSGTSMAAPHVVGLTGLILSVNPGLTRTDVRDLITSTADPTTDYVGQMGAGRINAYNAVLEAKAFRISHTPLSNTSDTLTPYTVIATIVSDTTLKTDSLSLFYRSTADSDTDYVRVPLLPTGNLNEFSADIPPQPVYSTIEYGLTAEDDHDERITAPTNFPLNAYSFHILGFPVLVSYPDSFFVEIPSGYVEIESLVVRNDGTDDLIFSLRVGALDAALTSQRVGDIIMANAAVVLSAGGATHAGASESLTVPERMPPAEILAARSGAQETGAIIAVVLDSWGADYSYYANWDYLNANYSDFGATPIVVDYATFAHENITYAELSASDAEVLIVSDAWRASDGWEFTPAEIAAIQQYLDEGHGLFVTGGTLDYEFNPGHMAAFAALLGLDPSLSYQWSSATTTPQNLEIENHPLFENMPDPYTVSMPVSVRPVGTNWAGALAGAELVAVSVDGYTATTAAGNRVYATSMPEEVEFYGQSPADNQFTYNAIVFCASGSSCGWLSAEPQAGSVPPGESTFVSVRFDALPFHQDTTLECQLNLRATDSLGSQVAIPAVMHVLPPDYYVDLSPVSSAKTGAAGDTVWYTDTLTNFGAFADFYNLTVTHALWPSSIWDSNGTAEITATPTLASGARYVIRPRVIIPETTSYGEKDTLELTVQSDGDPVIAPVFRAYTSSAGTPDSIPWLDEFVSLTLDTLHWQFIQNATVSELGIGEPSPPYALNLNGNPAGNDMVTSVAINLAGLVQVALSYWFERTGNGEPVDPGEDLIFEALDADSNWIEVSRQLGGGPIMSSFQPVEVILPFAVYHSAFRLRIRSIGSACACDDWFVDNVLIYAPIPPSICYAPASFDFDLAEDDSTKDTLIICNNGPGELRFQLQTREEQVPLAGTAFPRLVPTFNPQLHGSPPSATEPFVRPVDVAPLDQVTIAGLVEDFEDGDFSGWQIGSGPYQREVTSLTAAAGTQYSLAQTGGFSNHYDGVAHAIPAEQYQYAGFHVRTSNIGASGYVVIGDEGTSGHNGTIFFYAGPDGRFVVYPGDQSFPYLPNQWYHVEFQLDWGNQTFAYYVDGDLVATSLPFRNPTAHFSEIHLYNIYSATAWWDQIVIGDGPVAGGLLSLVPIADTIPPGETTHVALTINTTEAGAGDYLRVIEIHSNDPYDPQIDVPVSVRVRGPEIEVRPASITDSLDEGTTVQDTVWVLNIGEVPLTVFSVSSDVFWLNASFFGATVAPADSVHIVVTVGGAGFIPGNYTGHLTITSADFDEPEVVILFSVRVGPDPDIWVLPETLNVALDPEDSSWVSIEVGNDGLGTLGFTASVEFVAGPALTMIQAPALTNPVALPPPSSYRIDAGSGDSTAGQGLTSSIPFPGNAAGIAIDPLGVMHAADFNGSRIMRRNAGGGWDVYSAAVNYPYGVAFDTQGDLAVAEPYMARISLVHSDGSADILASVSATPIGLAYGVDGNLYVTTDGNSRVLRIAPGGAVSDFATGLPSTTFGAAFGADGRLYVSTFGDGRVLAIEADGSFSTYATIGAYLEGLAFDIAGNLYVGNGYNGYIYRVNPDQSVDVIGAGYDGPLNLALDENGTLWISSLNRPQIDSLPVGIPGVRLPVGSSEWLTLESASGLVRGLYITDSLTGRGIRMMRARFDSHRLVSPDHYGRIIYASNDPDEDSLIVPAHLRIRAPEIALRAESLFIEATEGAASDSVRWIINEGEADLHVTISADESWLLPIPSVLTAPPADSVGLIVRADATTLFPGNYSGTLAIGSDDYDEPQILIPVALHVGPDPDIAVMPESLAVSLTAGDSAETVLEIHNVGAGTLRFALQILQSEPSPSLVALWAGLPARTAPENTTSRDIGPGPSTPPMSHGSAAAPQRVAIFQESDPWGNTEMRDLLEAHGITYDILPPAAMGVIDLSVYDKTITASNQSSFFYLALSANRTWFEDFAQAGGALELHLASNTSTIAGLPMPGGFVTSNLEYVEDVTIVDPSHQIVTTPNTITDPMLDGWGSSLHGYLAALPAGAHTIVVRTFDGAPVCAEVELGGGSVIATLQTVDWYGASIQYLENLLLYDGLRAEWLIASPDEGIVAPGGGLPVNVSFRTAGLIVPDVYAQISISSNDPDENPFEVPVHMHLFSPEIAIRAESLTMEATEGDMTDSVLWVVNEGDGDLDLTVGADASWLIPIPGALTVPPQDSVDIIVRADAGAFYPGDYNASLAIESNDYDEGELLLPVALHVGPDPDIAVDPESLAVTLASGETTWVALEVQNTGPGTLVVRDIFPDLEETTSVLLASPVFTSLPFLGEDSSASPGASAEPPDPGELHTMEAGNSASSEGPSTTGPLEDLLLVLNAYYGSVNSIIPQRFDFADGVSGIAIADGGDNMYDYGNRLATDLGGDIPYSDDIVSASAFLGPGGRYFTRKYPGLFVMAADMTGVPSFRIHGGLGADGAGNLDGAILQAVVEGRMYYGFLKRVFNAPNPSVNHLIIVESPADHEFSASTDFDYHRAYNLPWECRLFYLLYAGTDGFYIDNSATMAIMSAFLDVVARERPWIRVDPQSAIVAPGSSATVNVRFGALGLLGGDHHADLTLVSNDPDEETLLVPARMHVLSPEISVNPGAVWMDALEGLSSDSTLWIINTGEIDLHAEVSSDAGWLTPIPGMLTVPPADSAQLTVRADAALLIPGDYSGTLAIESDDYDEPEVLIPVALQVGPDPDIAITPESLVVSLNAGDSADIPMSVLNNGLGTLEFFVHTQVAGGAPPNASVAYPAWYYDAIDRGVPDPRAGVPVVLGAGGPDSAGYRWIDSDEPGGPAFQWVEISGTGTPVTPLVPDSYNGPFPIGFDFPFYDSTYDQFWISTKGFIGFGPPDSYGNWVNTPLPAPNPPNNMIAWFWDDLYPNSGATPTQVYYYTEPGRLVVQFTRYRHWCCWEGPWITGEIIIHANGAILLQTLEVQPSFNNGGATVGIENLDGSVGLEVAFNTLYVHDGLAVRLGRLPDWLAVAPDSGRVPAGGDETVMARIKTADLEGTDYYAQIKVVSNDPDEGVVIVPVHLTVIGSPAPADCDGSHQGDVAGDDGAIDAVDLAGLIDHVFFGGPRPAAYQAVPSADRGDLNCDGADDVLDVTYMIDLVFYGGAGPCNPCDCQPYPSGCR